MKEEEKVDLLEIHKKSAEVLGFWEEQYKAVIIHQIENGYKTEILREWGISDMVMNGDKILFKFYKRFQPLTDDYLEQKYGRKIKKPKTDGKD